MANLSEDIQCAVLIPCHLCLIGLTLHHGNNVFDCIVGVNILKSIDEGPFQMETFRETLVEGNEGALHLGPERARIYYDLSPEDKERFTKLINDMRNIKMTMPIMQLNSKFVNNMLPEWGRFVTTVKLNRELKESNYDQLYAYLKQHEGRQNIEQRNNPKGAGAAGNEGAHNRVGNANPSHTRQIKCYNCNAQENGVVLDEEQLLFLADVNEAPTAQTMFMANLSSADPVYDKASSSYDSYILSEDVLKMKAEALKEQTSSSIPIKALTVYPPNTHATLVSRVLPIKIQVKIDIFALIQLFQNLKKPVKRELHQRGSLKGKGVLNKPRNVISPRKYDEIERKNLLIANDNLIVDCLSKEVFYIATNYKLTISRFTEMHDAHTVVQACCLKLEADLSKLNDKIQKDDHNELVKRFSNLEVNHLNL
ncbi:hypothetical protein Tco_0503111 [Tanacetum coccineum]